MSSVRLKSCSWSVNFFNFFLQDGTSALLTTAAANTSAYPTQMTPREIGTTSVSARHTTLSTKTYSLAHVSN